MRIEMRADGPGLTLGYRFTPQLTGEAQARRIRASGRAAGSANARFACGRKISEGSAAGGGTRKPYAGFVTLKNSAVLP